MQKSVVRLLEQREQVGQLSFGSEVVVVRLLSCETQEVSEALALVAIRGFVLRGQRLNDEDICDGHGASF